MKMNDLSTGGLALNRLTAIIALGALIAVAGSVFDIAPFAANPAAAQTQEEREENSSKRETRRVKSLSTKTYKIIGQVYEFIQEGQYVEALDRLSDVKRREKLPAYDQAVIFQTYGYIYSGTDKYAEAARSFVNMVRVGSEDLQPQVLTDALYYIAQLYISIEQYPRGIKYLRDWFNEVENPNPDAYVLMAHALVAQEPPKYYEAIPWIIKAIDGAKMQGNVPKENWYQLIRGLYFETDQVPEAVGVLEILVDLYPKKEYWMQLSAGYGFLDRETDQFTALEAAYRMDLLTKSDEFEELAQRYMYHGIPYRAAMVMEKGLKNGKIDQDKDTLELIANAFYTAQELDRAIPWYRQAAKAADKADLFVLLGQIYLQRQEWSSAVKAFADAIKKNKKVAKKKRLSNPGNVHLMMGVANFNQKKYRSARSAFRAARSYRKSKKDAGTWLRHLEREIKRQSQLN